MATYNGARFIREQLDSIAAQTVLPAELVITDDGSSDDTLDIVAAFARTAPFPVRVHENPARLGFRANFMRAIGLCTSEVIALCDQDDIWEPHKIARGLEPFGEPEVVLAFHEAWLIDAAGARLELARIYGLPARNPPSSLFPLRNPYGFSMMFRRRLCDFSDLWPRSVDNLHVKDPMAHDQWLFFLASAFGTIAFIEEPLAGYRQHDANTYGLEQPIRSLRDRMDRWINVRVPEYSRFATAAGVRAEILEAAMARLDPAWRSRAQLAIARYRQLVRHCTWRAAIYGASRSADRRRAWLALLRDGAYGNRTLWTFGRKAALVDLSCLVAPPRLLGALTARHRASPAIPAAAGDHGKGDGATSTTMS